MIPFFIALQLGIDFLLVATIFILIKKYSHSLSVGKMNSYFSFMEHQTLEWKKEVLLLENQYKKEIQKLRQITNQANQILLRANELSKQPKSKEEKEIIEFLNSSSKNITQPMNTVQDWEESKKRESSLSTKKLPHLLHTHLE